MTEQEAFYEASAKRMAARLGPWGGPPPREIHPLHMELSQRCRPFQGEDWDLHYDPLRGLCTAASESGLVWRVDEWFMQDMSQDLAVAIACALTRAVREGIVGEVELLLTSKEGERPAVQVQRRRTP